jgi:hypothetical protein
MHWIVNIYIIMICTICTSNLICGRISIYSYSKSHKNTWIHICYSTIINSISISIRLPIYRIRSSNIRLCCCSLLIRCLICICLSTWSCRFSFNSTISYWSYLTLICIWCIIIYTIWWCIGWTRTITILIYTTIHTIITCLISISSTTTANK